MVLRAIKNAFKLKENRGWDRIYFAIDLHSTVVKPNYSTDSIPTEFYPHSKEVLQELSKRDDIALIMWTCSHPHEIVKYVKFFKDMDIVFDHINKNPEVKTDVNGYGNYDDKPYMSAIIDDKAGFDADTEWEGIKEYFEL